MKNKKINLERYEYLSYTVDKNLCCNPYYEEEVINILEKAISEITFINNTEHFSFDEYTHHCLFLAINFAYRLRHRFSGINSKILEIIDNEEFIKYIDENINMVAYPYGEVFIHFIFEHSSKKEKYLKYYFKCVTNLDKMLHLNNFENYTILRNEIGDDAVYSYLSKYFWKTFFSYKRQDQINMFNLFRKKTYLLDTLKEALNYQKENTINFEKNHNFIDLREFIMNFPSIKELMLKCINIDGMREKNNEINICFHCSIYKKQTIIKRYENLLGEGWVLIFDHLNEELIFENLLPRSQILLFKAANKYKGFNENYFNDCLKEMNGRKLFKRDENGYYEITEKDLDHVIISKYI